MGREIVVDAYVLYKTCDPKDNKYLDAIKYLSNIKSIAMDFEKHIITEYTPCFRKNFASTWFKRMKNENRISFQSNKLSHKHESELVGTLCFDRSDIPYVGVASKACGKTIIAEDSDYTVPVKDYLKRELNVIVTDIPT